MASTFDPSELHILLVDDEEDIVEDIGHFLVQEGFNVHKAYTGSEALERATPDIDLIVLDMKLYCLVELMLIVNGIAQMQKSILKFAEKNIDIDQLKTWDEFIAVAQQAEDAGYVGIAFGGQPWQDITTFDSVALATGGLDWYKSVFIDLDDEAIRSDTMIEALNRMGQLRDLFDDNYSGRDWNLATAMVINDEAAFQIMGDWAKGEFLAAGKVPGEDFLCASTPGEGYLYNVDSFAMFEVDGDDKKAGQNLLAELIVGPNFQKVFNLNKGSIPARTDVSLDEFDSCAVTSSEDMAASSESGSLLPSYAHGMALRGAQAGAITDVVTAHFNSDMSSDEAVQMLADAVANSM